MDKNLGQVFTPLWVVNIILDSINYNNEQILTKKIMEPSFGDGAFLVEIVRRYIEIGRRKELSINQIRNGLENQIFGIEIDTKYFLKTIERLDQLCRGYDIYSVNWNLHNEDSLHSTKFNNEMDFVVGNPPYVRIHNLRTEQREFLKSNFKTCESGSIDLYVAFYELGLHMLNDNGQLSYITPNSFMYNQSSVYFRKYLHENLYLKSIINFSSTKIFNAATYNAIVNLSKSPNENFDYLEYEDNSVKFIDTLNLNDYQNKQWNLSSIEEQSFLDAHTDNRKSLENKYNIQYGFTTMRDKIYIAKEIGKINDSLVLFNEMPIEKELLKKIVKGSLHKKDNDYYYILFPYIFSEGKFNVIEETELKESYPFAYTYLLFHKEELLKRDMDNNAKTWYQFGRSQGLTHMNNEKLVIKHIVKNSEEGKIEVCLLPADVFVYSGIFITGGDLEEIKNTLESPEFYKYVCLVGKDMNGGYKSISTKMIKSFSL